MTHGFDLKDNLLIKNRGMASIVYVDEELPEITIHELVSLEEELEHDEEKKIGINVFTRTELKDPLFLLLQKEASDYPIQRKVEAMLDIHERLVGPPPKDIAFTTIPIYSVQRKDVSEDFEAFIQEYDRANQNKSYYIRRDELRDVFFSYESTNPTDFPQIKPSGEIELETKDHTVLFGQDGIETAQFKGCKTYKGVSPFNSRFDQLTLADKYVSKTTPSKRILFQGQTIEELDQFFTNLKHPRLEFLKDIKEPLDLYHLWKTYMEEGIDLEEYNEDEWKPLMDGIQALKEEAIYQALTVKDSTLKPYPVLPVGGVSFYESQSEVLNPWIPTYERVKTTLLDQYRLYTESNRFERISADQLPKRMIDFANLIHLENMEQSIELLRTIHLNEQKQALDEWIQSIYKTDMVELQEQVNLQKTKYERTEYSIEDEFDRPFTSIVPEIKNIQRGSLIVPEIEEGRTADEIFEQTEEFLMENEDPDAIPLQTFDDMLPVDLSEMEESQQELLQHTLRLIQELQRASGIPLNIPTLHSREPVLLRLSKRNQLKEKLPEIDDGVLDRLIVLPKDQWMEGIESLVPTMLYQTVRKALEDVHVSFINDVYRYLYSFIGLWVCDIQRLVLNRQFQFNIWQGSLNCIQAWSPYGMPMEGLKMKKEGVLNYFLCILQDLSTTPGSLWREYGNKTKEEHIQSFTRIFEEELKDTVQALQEQFKTFEKEALNKNLVEMGEKVKKQVTDTVEQRQKNRYLSDYMYFLKNLPSVLIESSIAKKIHLGCCLQLLNEKYRSDYDWSGYVKEAYKLKKLYATQRLAVKRPFLVPYQRDVVDKEASTLVQPKEITYETIPLQMVNESLEIFQPYVPVKDYQLMLTGIRHLTPILEKYMDVYRFTYSIPVSFQEDIYEMNSTDLLRMYRQLIKVQYRWIQLSNDKDYLETQFQTSLPIYEQLFERKGYLNEIQEQSYKRLIQYFIIRQLCFPALPEYAQKNTLTLQETTVSANLLKQYGGKVYQEMSLWINAKLFPTRIDFKEYISKQREQENLEKLTLIDQMTPEERRDYVETKKLGLLELSNYLEKFKESKPDETMEGEEVFNPRKGENDDEADPDDLHDDDY